MARHHAAQPPRLTIRDMITLVATSLTMVTCMFNPLAVSATRCVKVDYSEVKDIGEWRYEARINKCEGLPSSYVIKSDVVTGGIHEPTFRQERHHPGCCCRVTDYKEHRTVIGKVELRFKEVLACGCVPCHHHLAETELQKEQPPGCKIPLALLKYLSKRKS